MIVFGSSCFSSAVVDAAETMDVVSASQIICSEMAVGYSGRPIRFIKKNVSACYGRDVFVCQPNLRTLCVLIPCSILTVFFPILLLHHLLVDSTFLWHFLFSGTFLIYLIYFISVNDQFSHFSAPILDFGIKLLLLLYAGFKILHSFFSDAYIERKRVTTGFYGRRTETNTFR